MRIGCLQFAAQVGDINNNLNRADAVLSKSDPEDLERLDLLVLPELAFTGYNFKSLQEISPHLENAGSGISALWARTTALRYNCVTCVGYPEKVDVAVKWPTSPEYYNSAILVNGEGETIGNYRKRFLFSVDETWALEGPDGFFDEYIPGLGNTSMGICMDLNPYKFEAPWTAFEFGFHILEARSNLVIVSMSWSTQEEGRNFSRQPKEPDMDTLTYWVQRLEPLIRAESAEEIIVVFCNRSGTENEIHYAGTSAVIGIKDGEVNVYGLLGRGTKELLVVDTDRPPVAKLIQRAEGAKPITPPPDSPFMPRFHERHTSLLSPVADSSPINARNTPISPWSPSSFAGSPVVEGTYRSPTIEKKDRGYPKITIPQSTRKERKPTPVTKSAHEDESPIIKTPTAPSPTPQATRPSLHIPGSKPTKYHKGTPHPSHTSKHSHDFSDAATRSYLYDMRTPATAFQDMRTPATAFRDMKTPATAFIKTPATAFVQTPATALRNPEPLTARYFSSLSQYQLPTPLEPDRRDMELMSTTSTAKLPFSESRSNPQKTPEKRQTSGSRRTSASRPIDSSVTRRTSRQRQIEPQRPESRGRSIVRAPTPSSRTPAPKVRAESLQKEARRRLSEVRQPTPSLLNQKLALVAARPGSAMEIRDNLEQFYRDQERPSSPKSRNTSRSRFELSGTPEPDRLQNLSRASIPIAASPSIFRTAHPSSPPEPLRRPGSGLDHQAPGGNLANRPPSKGPPTDPAYRLPVSRFARSNSETRPTGPQIPHAGQVDSRNVSRGRSRGEHLTNLPPQTMSSPGPLVHPVRTSSRGIIDEFRSSSRPATKEDEIIAILEFSSQGCAMHGLSAANAQNQTTATDAGQVPEVSHRNSTSSESMTSSTEDISRRSVDLIDLSEHDILRGASPAFAHAYSAAEPSPPILSPPRSLSASLQLRKSPSEPAEPTTPKAMAIDLQDELLMSDLELASPVRVQSAKPMDLDQALIKGLEPILHRPKTSVW